MKKKSLCVILFALVLAFAACGGNSGESEGDDTSVGGETYVMRIGTGSGGKDPQSFYLDAYADALEKMSEGRIDVEVYHSGQLGNMAQLIQGVQDGSIDCVAFPTTYFSTVVPEINMLDVPYLWKDPANATRLLNENRTSLNDSLESVGVTLVSYIRNSGRLLLSSKNLSKLQTLDDLKKLSLKIYCHPSELLQDEVGALGGSPVGLDIGEVTPSLQNGTIDAAMVGVGIYAPFGMYEVAPWLLMAPNDPMISFQIVNTRYLESLPADLQQTVMNAATQVYEVSSEYSGRYEQDCLKEMTDDGLTVVEPSPEMDALLREALTKVGKNYIEKYPEMNALYQELKALNE